MEFKLRQALLVTVFSALLVFSTGGVQSSLAHSVQGPDPCLDLFRHRDLQSHEAYACYEGQIQSGKLLEREKLHAYSQQFLILALELSLAKQRVTEITDEGEKLAAEYLKAYPSRAEGYYWRAVFVSRGALERDGNAMIPVRVIKTLGPCKSDLRKAISIDRSVHGYGPERVLGIFFREPDEPIGSMKKAEENLTSAYRAAPDFAANAVELAKFYLKAKRFAEGRAVLKALIELPESSFNPDTFIETQFGQKDALELDSLLGAKH